MDPLLEARPALATGLLDVRSVARETSAENTKYDLATLDRFPLLDGLHPGLPTRLNALNSGTDDAPYYALPYSVRWAPAIMKIYALLNAASDDVALDDPDFSAYLSLRARDLVSDDYEGGDAAWVRGQFKHLNAQIGSYEVYGDALYGVKSLFSLSLLARDEEKSLELNEALSPWGSHYEELKADLVSLFTSARMNHDGSMSDELFRSVQAGGVLRVLQNNQPRTEDQPYQTMQLMQMNYFLEHGALSFDRESARLNIHYEVYDSVATKMLGEVLAIQATGDAEQAGEFIQRYTSWTPELHERLVKRLRDSAKFRYRMVRYKALHH